jgi:hypothetical protein
MSLFSNSLISSSKGFISSLSGSSLITQIAGDAFSTIFASQVKAGDRALIGGISLSEAKKLYKQQSGMSLAKANLWCLNINNLRTGIAPEMNMFAKSVSTSPLSFAGEVVDIGSASFSKPGAMAPVEMRVTTFDDLGGSIKGWAKNLKKLMAPGDGTFGLPITYLLRVTLIHGFINMSADNAGGAYIDNYIMQLMSAEYTNNRSEDGLQEIELNFREFDTCNCLV